jgi:hypothetical protein
MSVMSSTIKYKQIFEMIIVNRLDKHGSSSDLQINTNYVIFNMIKVPTYI